MSFALIVLFAAGQKVSPSTPTLDGRAAAGYAYAHVFDHPASVDDDRTAFAAAALAAGGWTLPRSSRPDDLERALIEPRRGVTVREIGASSRPDAVPGDIVMADWGVGDENAAVEKNRATGSVSDFLVVTQSLGGGDFVFGQNAGVSRSRIGRFSALRASSSLALAHYRIVHVAGNNPTGGFAENGLYRDANRLGVYLHVNGGLFWAHDDANVKAFGGWDKLHTLPKDTMDRRTKAPIPGTMVRELHDEGVWMIEGDLKRHVETDAAVRRLGGWEAVRTVPDGSIQYILLKEGRALR